MLLNDSYIDAFLLPMQQCLLYKPLFGTSTGLSEYDFLTRFGEDYFYESVGLAVPEMYKAHKAAGGITSFYRQLGIACENLTRSVFIHELGIPEAHVRWEYTLPTGTARDRILKLDARLEPELIADPDRREVARDWLLEAARDAGVEAGIAQKLKGAVFEVRQGYKSADSKRQNADLSFGVHALKDGYLPCLLVFSGQVSEVVAERYRAQGLYVLLGCSGRLEHLDTRVFFKSVVGWDLVAWLHDHGGVIKTELQKVVKYLLS